MTESAQIKARQLLDAQVTFLLQQLTPDRLASIVREETTYLYGELDKISLTEAVSADKIKATAHRYALEMEIGGAIPELFGEIAHLIYEHPAQEDTQLSDIVSSRIAQEFLDKIFESGSLLDQVVRQIQQSSPFKTFLADVVLLAVKGYLQEQNKVLGNVPILGTSLRRLRALLDERLPTLQDGIADASHDLLERSIGNTLGLLDQLLDQDIYRDQALTATLNLWDEISTWPLSRLREFASENDLQELMVLGYEFWREFRETDYLVAIIDMGVEFFFAKYGEDSLQKIITEMGVTYEMIESELLNYSEDLAGMGLEKGIAETIVRRHLERFYFSAETLAILADTPATSAD
ncbi:MAG TPA: hypothetical protein VM553_20860 [Dongiaceae bacterium]|nr:hypothetical protein [Dongiaceae bacterium]